MIPYGVHYNLPASDYHALPGASSTRIRAFHGEGVTAAHAKVKLDEPFEITPFMIMGTLTHEFLLEPHKPSTRLEIQPETYGPDDKKWNGNAKECQRWREKVLAGGRVIIKKSEKQAVGRMIYEIQQKKEARELIQDAKTEVSIITEKRGYPFPFKARFDIVPKGKALADIKCVRDVSDQGFFNLAYDRGYHIQAAYYLSVWNQQCGTEEPKSEFAFIAVENVAPFACRVFNCTNQFLERGREDMALCLRKYAECVKLDEWPGYVEGYAELGLPGYIERQIYG